MKIEIKENDFSQELLTYLMNKVNNMPITDEYVKETFRDYEGVQQYFQDAIQLTKIFDTVPYTLSSADKELFEYFVDDKQTALISFVNSRLDVDEPGLASFCGNIEIDFADVTEALTWVQNSEFTASIKYKYTLWLTSFDQLKMRWREILTYYDEVQMEFLELTQRKSVEFIKWCNDSDILDIMKNEYHIFPTGINEIVISPCHISPYSVRIMAFGTKLTVQWGVSTDSITNIVEDEKDLEKNILKLGKVLGEQSKLDILIECMNEEHYGNELATILNLSGATVSHHVNHLLSDQYIGVRIDRNRAYYRTNLKKLVADLNDTADYFTKIQK